MPKQKIKKVVLAYSGGLDTSIILKWLQTEYGAEVVTFTADLGQGGELEPARKKAEMLGIKSIYVEDVRAHAVARGWLQETEDLDANSDASYLALEELIEVPVALLSTSPERDDTILVTDPFAD